MKNQLIIENNIRIVARALDYCSLLEENEPHNNKFLRELKERIVKNINSHLI